jgi:hypothetical protein
LPSCRFSQKRSFVGKVAGALDHARASSLAG